MYKRQAGRQDVLPGQQVGFCRCVGGETGRNGQQEMFALIAVALIDVWIQLGIVDHQIQDAGEKAFFQLGGVGFLQADVYSGKALSETCLLYTSRCV